MMLVPVFALALCITASYADPYSPFNRNKVHPDNYHPSGISVGPQFGAAIHNHPSLETQNNKFDVIYQWQIMDFEYPSAEAKRQALATG